MPKSRLFVDEIVSIGVVESGDNPEAEVLLFKSRTPAPKITTAEVLEGMEKARSLIAEVRQDRARRGEPCFPMRSTTPEPRC